MTDAIPLPLDFPPETDPTLIPRPCPLFPELKVWHGIEPFEIEIRKGSRVGQPMGRIDLDEPDLPRRLPPGVYWLVAVWPSGAGRPRNFPGGVRRHEVDEPPPPAPAVAPEMLRVLDSVAQNQAATTRLLEGLDHRLRSIENGASTGGGAATGIAGSFQALLEKLALRALEPPPAPVAATAAMSPLAQLRELGEGLQMLQSWKENGGPPPREPTPGELAVQVLDRVGTAVERLPEAVARARVLGGAAPTAPNPTANPSATPADPLPGLAAGPAAMLAGLSPRALADALRSLSPIQLGEWLADAVDADVLSADLVEPINVPVLAQALSLGPEWADRLAQAVDHCNKQLEIVPELTPVASSPASPSPSSSPAPVASSPVSPAPSSSPAVVVEATLEPRRSKKSGKRGRR